MMPIILAAATTLYFTAPPKQYVHDEPTPGWTIREMPFADIADICSAANIKTDLGCEIAPLHIIFLPSPDTSPYDADCLAMNRRHAFAHTYGWPESHPDGRVYICHLKR